jgi:hypothetical protein
MEKLRDCSVVTDRGLYFQTRISPEIQKLQTLMPDLYKNDIHKACFQAEYNFIGAMILKKWSSELEVVYEEEGVSFPKIFENPVEVLDEIPLCHHLLYTQPYQKAVYEDGEPMIAHKVLVKNVCGERTGVVLSPPFEGLILRPLKDGTGSVKRLWNDKSLSAWNPEFPDLLGLKKSYYEYTENLSFDYCRSTRDDIGVTGLFLRLVHQELGIDINPDDFQRTGDLDLRTVEYDC